MMGRDEWIIYQGQMVDGKYHLQELLGDPGGSGAVFRANEVVADRMMGRPVALKLIPIDQSQIDKQLQELQATATLKHENILDHYSRGMCSLRGRDFLYIAMEVADETLRQRLRKGRLSDSEALELARQIASALDYMHSQAETWVHRDVTSANIMRVGDRWKLADFGLTQSTVDCSGHRTLDRAGTAGYAPPEAYDGIVSSAWDVWSLGVVLLEALTGENSFGSERPEQAKYLARNHQPEMPEYLSEPLLSVIASCIEKRREARPTALSLSSCLNQSPPSAPRPATLIYGTAPPTATPSPLTAQQSTADSATEWTYRLIADAVDMVGCVALAIICIVLANLCTESSGVGVAAGQSLARIVGVLGAAGYLLSPALRGGRTLGKWLMGLAVVDANERRPMPGRVVLRQALAIVPLCAAFLLSVALGLVAIALYIVADAATISPGVSKGRQRRWYDTVSGTSVVRIGMPLLGFK